MAFQENQYWLKENNIKHFVFPQVRNFCGIASCCSAVNILLGTDFTQESLHRLYGVGQVTKLKLGKTSELKDLEKITLSGSGMSNWDIIRLFNSVLLDHRVIPYTAILCGDDFYRETRLPTQRDRLFAWLKPDQNQAVIHLVNHYTLFSGIFINGSHRGNRDIYMVMADPSSKKGPISCCHLQELQELAEKDDRYGIILLSANPIPKELFFTWTGKMLPGESTRHDRFERISKNR